MKYNDSLTKQLEELAMREGAAHIGFGPVERYAELPRKCGPRPTDVYPAAKTVVSVAVQMPDACMERAAYHLYDDPESGLVNVLVSLRLNLIASKIARMLENNGYTAFPVAATVIWRFRPYKQYDAPFISDLSHRHMAVGAGLGEFGWNGLFMSPVYGPRVRLVSVVTDAALAPTPMYSGEPLCDRCMRCVNQCGKHIKALTEGTKGKVSIRIGGKLCEYANKNLWYCAWTENLSIRHDKPKPEVFDEEHICEKIKDIVYNHPDWYESWTVEPCWGECLPPWLRKYDPEYSKVPRRAKELKLTGSRRKLTEAVRDNISEISKFRFEKTDITFIDLAADNELAEKYRYFQPDMNTLIAVRVPLNDNQGIAKYMWYRTIDLELSIITWLDSMGYGAMQLSFLRNRMNDKGIVSRAFEKYNVTDYVNHDAGDNRLVEAVLTSTDFIEGNNCRIAFIGSDIQLDNLKFTADRKTKLPPLGASATPTASAAPVASASANDAVPTSAFAFSSAASAATHASAASIAASAASPSAAALKAELRSLAAKLDTDLIGFSGKERMDSLAAQLKEIYRGAYRFEAADLNPGKGPYIPEVKRRDLAIPTIEDRLPGARSVIVLGARMSDGIVDTKYDNPGELIGPYVVHKSYLRDLLSEYAHKMTEHLNLRGYRAAAVIDLFGTASVFTYPIREFREDLFSSRYAAVAAGLGELGHHGMLLTPQYGVRQLLVCIVTDAPLESDPLYSGKPVCLNCKKCVASCPANAISGARDQKIVLDGRTFTCGTLKLNCCDWSRKYCLTGDEGPKYNGSITDIVPPAEVTAENLAEALTHIDPLQKDYMLAMEPCFIHCPAHTGGK